MLVLVLSINSCYPQTQCIRVVCVMVLAEKNMNDDREDIWLPVIPSKKTKQSSTNEYPKDMNLDPDPEALKSFSISGDYSFSECSDHFESAGGSDNFFTAIEDACSEPIEEEDPQEEPADVKLFRCSCRSLVHRADLLLHSSYCDYFQPYVLVEKYIDADFYKAHGLPPPRSPIRLRLRKSRRGYRSCTYSDTDLRTFVLEQALKMTSEGAASDTVSYGELGDAPPPLEGHEDSHESLSTPTPADLESSAQSFSTDPNNDSADGETAQTNGIASPSPNPESKPEEEKEEEPRSPEKPRDSENEEDKSSTASTTSTPTSRIRMRPMDDLMAATEVKVEDNEGPLSALNVMISDLKTPQMNNKPYEQMPPSLPPTLTPIIPSMAATILPPVASSPILQAPNPPAVPVPNLPAGVSLQKRPPPPNFPTGVTITKQARRDSESSSASSLSPSATPPPPRLPEGITLVRPGQPKAQDPVANLLASRGVSVMSSQGQTSLKKVASPQQVRNNGALTITTAVPNSKRQRPGTSVMATVDLTDDSAPSIRRPMIPAKNRAPAPIVRPRGPAASTVTCDVCDKVFAHGEALRQHMQTHAPGRRPMAPGSNVRQPAPTANGVSSGNSFQCRFCIARYPNQLALSQHMQRFHPDKFGGSVGSEFALPVVDLSDSRTMNSLVSLGVKFCIPLGNLSREEGGGVYGVPVVPMDGATNPAVCSLGRMNCSNLLPLGPMKSVMRQ